MQPLEIKKYLFDILSACEQLESFTAGENFEGYVGNAMLRSAVERQFEIIGEALRQMIHRAPSMAERITNYERIIAFRNKLIHAYAHINDAVVWGILEKDLAVLKLEVSALLVE